MIQWLRKLGILRTGAVAARYRNAVERPLELQVDDVLDAKRDLTGRPAPKPAPPPVKPKP